MIILLDTSTPVCKLTLVDGDFQETSEWEAGRTLAKNLLKFLADKLAEHDWIWEDITGLGVFRGPGSFTGLRIGMTVMNTLADGLVVPIVGAMGEKWQTDALAALARGEDEKIVLPEYGGAAHITTPRK